MTTPPRSVRRMGDRALLVRCDDVTALLAAIDREVAAGRLDGVEDVVPASGSLLVRHTRRATAAALARVLAELPAAPLQPHRTAHRHIEVVYDGPDLDEVARHVGVSREAVVSLHAEAEYAVAFCGFAPGFAYLTGLPTRLHLPRLDVPRIRVPAGSVAIAAAYAGVYPRASPGGWRLLGRTAAVLFDVDRDPPALLSPGDRVRFVPIRP